MIMAEVEAAGDVSAELPEMFTHTLTDRLNSFEACGTFDCVDADTLGDAVVDGCEYVT